MYMFMRNLSNRIQAMENGTSLRTQIAVAAAAMAMLLTGILGGTAAYISYRNTAALVNATLATAANNTAARLDQGIAARSESIKVFSELEPLRELSQKDPASLRKTLDQLQNSFADFAWIGFADTDGVITAASGGMLQGVSAANQSWFQAGLKGITVGDIQEAGQLSTLLGLPSDGKPHRFIDIAVPVYGKNREVVGVLGAHLGWGWVQHIIGNAEDTDGDGIRDTNVSLTTADGTVLHGASDTKIKYDSATLVKVVEARVATLANRISPDTIRSAFAVSKPAKHPGGNWVVTASQPASVANVAAIEAATTMLSIGAITGLVGVLFAILIAQRIARPFRAITEDADRIGRDPGPAMLPRQNGSLETVQLAHALRSLLRRIGFAEERTREASENAIRLRDDLLQMQRLASTDDLTELLNRRAFLEATDAAMVLSRGGKRDSATLMIDIDHFKRINDQHGHAAGDTTIRRVAEIVRNNISGADQAARFGGEEFVVLLHNVDGTTATAIAERLRLAIENAPFDFGETRITVTVSIGIAMIAAQDRDMQDMIERADRGLYLAKQGGRNRVAIAHA